MENAANPFDEKLQILKRIEEIGNRNFDGVDVTKLLKNYLNSVDPEIMLSALQASSSYAADESLFQEIFKMAHDYSDEEVRAVANSCLGAVIQDGLCYEEKLPPKFTPGNSSVTREFYFAVREFLIQKVDAPMESMEVRRRALEALGYLGFLPEIRKIIMRFYHQAPNPFVKVSALYAMGMIKDPIFERLILEELYSEAEPVLLEAVHSAAGLELHAALDRLLELSKSPSPELRYETTVALGSLAPMERLPEILRLIEKDEKVADVHEAIRIAKNLLRQRLALIKGETIWDDHLILNEIDEILDNPESESGPSNSNDGDSER